MPVPTIEFYPDQWLQITNGAVYGELVLKAFPPVSVTCGVLVFSRLAGGPWAVIDESRIDNIAHTPIGPRYRCIFDQGREYVLRFQGEAHLLMPGYQDIELAFSVSDDTGSAITDFGGAKIAAGTHSAAIAGQVFLRGAQ